jgi:hypothetical protein
MKRTLVFCLTAAVLLSTPDRAPAPIAEESPIPTATTKPRSKFVAESKPTPRATVKPKPTPFSFVGTWETNYNNEMRVSQTGDHVSGTYDQGRGVIDGTISGNILSGSWTRKNDRGVFRLSLSSDGNSFSGTWSRSDGSGGPWIGTRK